MDKVLFSADWHIKLGQKNVPKDWQINRFRLLYKELHKLEDEVDIHVIGGDIFESVPNLEELLLFSEFAINIKKPTYIYSGNHEATRKGKTFFSTLKPILENLNPLITVIEGISKIDNIDIIGYECLKTFDPKEFTGNILMTHVRGDIPPHVKAEIDLSLFSRWDTVYAGDLHSNTNSQLNIVYPGSPMTTTFHRTKTKTGVLIIEPATNTSTWIPLKLPQLVRKTVDTEEEMIPSDFDHTVYELTGELSTLSKVTKHNPLLDKKVVTREVDSKIDFSKTKTVVEELVLYLQEVKGIKDTDDIVKTYNDNIQRINME